MQSYLAHLKNQLRSLENGGWTSVDEVIHQMIVKHFRELQPNYLPANHWKRRQSKEHCIAEEIVDRAAWPHWPFVQLAIDTLDYVRYENGELIIKKASLRKCSQCGHEHTKTDMHWYHDCLHHGDVQVQFCVCGSGQRVLIPRMVPRDGCRIPDYPMLWPIHFSECVACIQKQIDFDIKIHTCKNCGDYGDFWNGYCSKECRSRASIERKRRRQAGELIALQSILAERMETSNVKQNHKNITSRY
jgi:hypothetical protein